jgi:hypothetical protein
MKPVMPKPCPEFGGRRVVVEDHVSGGIAMALPIPDSRIYLQQSQRSTGRFYRWNLNTSPTVVLTCIQCGYTACYATEPSHLIPDQ